MSLISRREELPEEWLLETGKSFSCDFHVKFRTALRNDNAVSLYYIRVGVSVVISTGR